MIIISFLKARHGGWRSKLISLLSFGKYSHVEIYFTTANYRFSAEKGTGTFRKRGLYDAKEVHKYDYLHYEMNTQTELALFEYLNRRVGKRYDWRGLLGIFFPFLKHDYDKYFCTEYILEAMQKTIGWPGKTLLTPSQMYNQLHEINLYGFKDLKDIKKKKGGKTWLI